MVVLSAAGRAGELPGWRPGLSRDELLAADRIPRSRLIRLPAGVDKTSAAYQRKRRRPRPGGRPLAGPCEGAMTPACLYSHEPGTFIRDGVADAREVEARFVAGRNYVRWASVGAVPLSGELGLPLDSRPAGSLSGLVSRWAPQLRKSS